MRVLKSGEPDLNEDIFNYDSNKNIVSVKEIARVNRWSDDYDVKTYIR